MTREDARHTLAALARGADAPRLLERVAQHESSDVLRGVLAEVGAVAIAEMTGPAGSTPSAAGYSAGRGSSEPAGPFEVR